MAQSYNTVTVTTDATLIVPANTGRRSLLLGNDGSTKCYIGPDSSITTSNAMPFFQSEKLVRDLVPEGYLGAVYGIVASGTTDIRYWETSA